ncbi:MAG: transglutaminase domain-containing protein [Acidobacteria bacterium]|nr:transglutaminase domain-containing protein [Acidobacteriota bacterium]
MPVLWLKVLGHDVRDVFSEAGRFSRQTIRNESDNGLQIMIHKTQNAEEQLQVYSFDLNLSSVKNFLVSTAFADSDNLKIKSFVRSLSQKRKRPVLYIVRSLIDLVTDHFSRSGSTEKPHVGIVSGSESLNLDRGDCTEYSILLVTLLRALGIPSRVVAGLIYDDGRFSYHMWVQVFGRNGWVDVDPAYHQVGVDATHFAVCSSDLSRSSVQRMQQKIFRLLHQIKIELYTESKTTKQLEGRLR